MIAVFAIFGGLGFLGPVIASLLYLFDAPTREQRVRAEVEAQQLAWRIQEHTKAAVNQMLDAARAQRERQS